MQKFILSTRSFWQLSVSNDPVALEELMFVLHLFNWQNALEVKDSP
jgi:hypothetical protein